MSNQDITNLNAVTASILPSPTFNVGLNGLNVSGLGEIGFTGTVTITNQKGEIVGSGLYNSLGRYSFNLTKPQLNGEKLFATLTDGNGNSSLPVGATAPDITPPEPPSVVFNAAGSNISGVSEPDARIKIVDSASGRIIATAIADKDGTYSVTIKPALTNGQEIEVTAMDLSDLISEPAVVKAPVVILPNSPTDVEVVDGGTTVTGKAESGQKIDIKDANGKDIGTGITDSNGNFEIKLDVPQKNGEPVSVTATDLNTTLVSPPTEVNAPDLTPPNAPTATVDQTTGEVVTGKAQPNSDIEVKDATGKVIGTGKTDSNGDYSVKLDVPQKNGETVTVTASDAGGKSPATNAQAPDLTPPNAPTATVDQTTGEVVTGKAQPNSDIEVKDTTGKVIGTGKTDSNGDYSVKLDVPQKNGETVTVTASDAGGKSPATNAQAPDLTPPNAPTATVDQNTGEVVTGKAQPNSDIEVKDATGKVIGTDKTDANGDYFVKLDVPQKDGETVTVTASDTGGKSPATNAQAPDLTPPQINTLEFSAKGDVLSGTTEGYAKVEIKDAAGKVIANTTADANGSFSVTFSKPFGSGEGFSAKATDAHGNTGDAKFVQAPTLLMANSDVVHADVDLGYVSTTTSKTTSVGFGSLGTFLGIPICGTKSAEVNFSVNPNQTSTVNIKAYNTSLASFLDGIKVTLYKQSATGVWQKVADSKDKGLFNKFFLFSESTGLQVKSLDAGNYKVVAEDTTLFGILSGNKLSVTQNTTTTSSDLEAIKANPVSGNLMVDDVVPTGTTLTKLVSDTGASVNVPTAGKATLVGKYGTMLINADGSYTYTPNKDVKVVGQVDTFTYTITDKNGNASTAKVYVQIGADEVNLKWDPTNPSKPATMLQLNDDTDFVIGTVKQSTAVTSTNVDSGLLSAQSCKIASINSNTFTVGNTGETSIKVDFKSATGCYTDPSKTTFNWQLQKYNAQTGQWVNVSGASGSKSYGFVGSVSSSTTVFEQTVKVTDAGQYRVNFQTNGGLYSSSFLAQKFDTNVTVQTTSPDKWTIDSFGTATGNIFTGEGVDTIGKDSLGFGKKLSVSTDGGLTFKDVSATGLTVSGKFGSLLMKADGSYTYTQNKGTAGSDDFVYKVVAGNGETQTAHLEVNAQFNVKGSAASDVFSADQIMHVLEMGAGADTVKFTSLNTVDQGDYWTDFSKVQGDKIDVSTLLSNKNVTSANISEYLTVEQKGTNTVIKIDLDAKGTQYEAKELVVLQNTNTTLDELLKGNHLVF